MPDVRIETATCVLRSPRSDDADGLVSIANDAAVARYVSPRFPYPYTRENAVEWLASLPSRPRTVSVVIELEGALCGVVTLELLAEERAGVAELHCWLSSRVWGRGIAADASRALTEYGFSHFDLRRVQAHVIAPNVNAMRVLEKAGFRREAVLAQSLVARDGSVHDDVLYFRLKPQAD